MKVVVCLNHSTFTEKYLDGVRAFILKMKEVEITVIHIFEETMFYATAGFDVQIGDEMNREGKELQELAHKYLGDNINYIEEMGVPVIKIDEILDGLDYDMIIVGGNTHDKITHKLSGSVAEHLSNTKKKPVIIIP